MEPPGQFRSLAETLKVVDKPEEAANAAEYLIRALDGLKDDDGTKENMVLQMKNEIREAGVICPLVAWLNHGANCEVAQFALTVLQNLARGCPANRDEIRVAGGIQPLIDLLAGHPLVPLSAGGTHRSDNGRAPSSGAVAPALANDSSAQEAEDVASEM
eukprot:472374-Prymnesium_polylepis.1